MMATLGISYLDVHSRKALQHYSEVALVIGKHSSHLVILSRTERRYFFPELSGKGPTTSKYKNVNLFSGTSILSMPGSTVLDCLASWHAWQVWTN